ncbi:MAG: hypothetical protein MN733_23345, partial [Nitrososphaera sp.]|nr:hypothetical protein [Nitrososphaera sp.]
RFLSSRLFLVHTYAQFHLGPGLENVESLNPCFQLCFFVYEIFRDDREVSIVNTVVEEQVVNHRDIFTVVRILD